MKKFIFAGLFASLLFTRMMAAITTPYPTEIELHQIYGATHEATRLAQGHNKYDRQPTGFYLDSLKTAVVNVEVLTPAADGAMPYISIGTLGFNVDGRGRVDIPLTVGLNTITPAQKAAAGPGGLIYLSFVTNGNKAPEGVVRITFTAASEHVRAPHYVYGVTTDAEFREMLEEYPTPDVVYHSDYVVVAATKSAANTLSKNNNKTLWMDGLHTLLAREDTISGMDNNDPNPVHHRLKAGEVRYLLVQNTSSSPHAASSGYTGYPSASIARYLTVFGPNNNSWMLGHELGHQHQQPAYMINQSSESTVNIYSYVAEKPLWEAANPGQTYNRTTAARWKTAQDTYLKLPITKRVYDMNQDSLEKITGFNRDELRFMVWEQLFLLFGNEFYKNLHRVVREEKVTGGGADERRFYLIWKASQVSGYDLREYFNQWGIRVTDAALKNSLRYRLQTATESGAIIALPQPLTEVLKITGQNRPDWSPLPLRGITTSAPTQLGLDPSDWTITANIGSFTDNGIGGNLVPEFIIDGQIGTAYAFVKPGKTYEE
ncbi:hypothetical protein AGMMS49525_00010 [Bacteroidia bacterium]|nr:hypothetical protein AGMMS49525_00010 [Bacteroidia bacterium]